MKRSISSILIDRYLRLLPTKKIYSDPKTFDKTMENIKRTGDVPYELNYKKFTVDMQKESFEGMDYYVLNAKNNKCSNKLLYFHGGAYAFQPAPFVWKALNKISKDANIEIWMPIYPKIPFHDAEYTYDKLLKFYIFFTESFIDGEVILMGDSAGGGLTLGMAQKIRDMSLKQPVELIMISPWLDVATNSPASKEIEPHDVLLGFYGPIKCGEMWAGSRNIKDPIVSPLYGELKNLGNITVFSGTYDILNADAHNLMNKAKKQHVDVTLFEKEYMPHDYPFTPSKEGKLAIETIVGIITGI